MSPEDVIAAFVAAVEQGNVDAALLHLAPECEYDNVPIGKAVGHEAIRQTLAMFVAPENPAQFKVLRQAAQGNVVFNERIDRMVVGGKEVEIAVAGVWEVDPTTGKITLWRDYFDMGQVNSQLA
jgi:limonene-1,2-epoxide hydrolase